MIISAVLVKKPRRLRTCDLCWQTISGPVLRLYGAAQQGDKPYVLFLHPDCCGEKHPKIEKALLVTR